MRKTLMLGVVALVAALGVPATASAHHLEQDTSTITCVLVNNAPVIRVSAHYVDFTVADQPITYSLRIDSVVAASGQVPLNTSSDFRHDFDTPTTPGAHTAVYTATWNNSANGGYLTVSVVCPAPVPPPVLCNGVPVPPGTNCVPPPPPPPTLTCNGTPAPAGTTVCAPPPPKRHHHRCVPNKLRLHVAHRRLVHGEQAFVVKGIGWRHVKWVHWTVRRPGGAWHKVGTSGRPWEHVVNHGLKWRIYLWVESVWGYPQWGRHQVRAKVRVKGACGTRTVVVKRSYMNHDPEPRAHAWN
jgi:hypothetical protein